MSQQRVLFNALILASLITVPGPRTEADLILALTGSDGNKTVNYSASGGVTTTQGNGAFSLSTSLGLAPRAGSGNWSASYDVNMGEFLNDYMNTSSNDELVLSDGGVSYRRNGVEFGVLELIALNGKRGAGHDAVELDTTGVVNYPALFAGDILSWVGSGTFTLEGGETWGTLFNKATTAPQTFSNPIAGGLYSVVIQTQAVHIPEPNSFFLLIAAAVAITGFRRRRTSVV